MTRRPNVSKHVEKQKGGPVKPTLYFVTTPLPTQVSIVDQPSDGGTSWAGPLLITVVREFEQPSLIQPPHVVTILSKLHENMDWYNDKVVAH